MELLSYLVISYWNNWFLLASESTRDVHSLPKKKKKEMQEVTDWVEGYNQKKEKLNKI